MPSEFYDNWVRTIAEGKRVEVVDQREAEAADFVICRLVTDPLLMPDNLVGTCKCFRMIQFRPHVPKLPKKICDVCAEVIIKADKIESFLITPATAKDVARFVAAKKNMN
jgi:hypothetical protein